MSDSPREMNATLSTDAFVASTRRRVAVDELVDHLGVAAAHGVVHAAGPAGRDRERVWPTAKPTVSRAMSAKVHAYMRMGVPPSMVFPQR
jgi:hypothetical protein